MTRDNGGVKPAIPNVLAGRYASDGMAELWSPAQKVVLERRLWLAVLRAQADLGVAVPAGAIEAYQRVVDSGVGAVDLARIAERERVTRHDVKARIEEFNELASARAATEQIHKGMTSRDLTENVEQLQIRSSLAMVRTTDPGRARAPGPPRGRVRLARDGRPLAQRRGAGHHARQAVRDGRRRDAGGARPSRRPARALPAARHQGSGRHRRRTCSTCSTAIRRGWNRRSSRRSRRTSVSRAR